MSWMTGSITALAGTLGVMAGAVAMPENNLSLAPLTAAVLVEIETTANLLATKEVSPMILAAAPASAATDAVTTSAPDSAATPAAQYDAVYSVCAPMHSADQSSYNIETENGVSPMTPIYSYLFEHGVAYSDLKTLSVQVTVLKSPAHGELLASGNKAFSYRANQGYLGADQMTFEVDTMGKKFKVIETLVIHNSGNLEYPTNAAKELFDKYCPSDKGSSLDIIELHTDGFVSDEELAKLHSMVSFALGSGVVGNGGLSFVDLPGAAVGQTVGSTITLDTNAAGYNWFIDPTLGSNEEWLPTSEYQSPTTNTTGTTFVDTATLASTLGSTLLGKP